jgi:hypothetical protein
LVFLLLVALAYGPAWMFVRWMEPFYVRLLALGLDQVYGWISGKLAFGTERGMLVFRSAVPPLFKADIGADQAYANLPFLMALLLVTPGMRMPRRWVSLGCGCGLLYLTHLAFLVTKVESSLIQAAHPLGNGNQLVWASLDYSMEFLGKGFFPVGIWLLFALPYMTGHMDERRPQDKPRTAGRNDPCPCGSGKKYKNCCGRT